MNISVLLVHVKEGKCTYLYELQVSPDITIHTRYPHQQRPGHDLLERIQIVVGRMDEMPDPLCLVHGLRAGEPYAIWHWGFSVSAVFSAGIVIWV